MKRIYGWITILIIVAVTGRASADEKSSSVLPTEIDFNRDVRPILADNCYECHGPDEHSREADLRLDVLDDAFGWVIDPGHADESLLIARLLSNDPHEVMPPPESKRRPTAKQVEILRQWIKQGAEYENHWAFVAPQRLEIPKVAHPAWSRNALDAFVLKHLESHAMQPQPDAEPHILARRLSLALTGLPVLPENSERFVSAFAADPEQAVSDYVDELLASAAYGEHLAWVWMDAARYADTNGYQGDGYRIMWPWRDWLIRNLNANLPFDQMTEQMLAGDLLLPKEQQNWKSADWIANDRSNDLLVATGFLRNHRYDTGSGTIPAESKFENAADRMETVGTVWTGLTMLCARCHTHKYDPIENGEYYELLSFFDNVPEVGSALKAASHPYIHTPTAVQRAKLEKLQQAVKEAKAVFRSAETEIAAAQQKWENNLHSTVVDLVKDPMPLTDVVDLVKDPSTQNAIQGSLTRATTFASGARVMRGLKFRYAQDPLRFDGNESIEKSNDPISLCAGNKRWTISFWFRPESKAKGAIFSSVEEPQRHRPGIQADWIDGRVRVRHVCRWINSYIEFESKEKLTPGEWYHVTFRCDGRMQGLAYSASLDGSDDAMICTHPVTNDGAGNTGKAPLVLGDSPLMPGFVGSLRDLRFYDRLLEHAEVRSLSDVRTTTEIARIPRNERTTLEAETLQLAFLESEQLPDEFQQLQDNYLAAIAELNEAIRKVPTTMVMKEEQTEQTRVRKAGVFDSLGEQVETDIPDFLPPITVVDLVKGPFSQETATGSLTRATPGGPDRLMLARWLTHPEHPLTARVAVNRIWQMLWGRGFVDSPENFGTQCPEPLHADLLDWLATEYVRLGWDTKALIKLIVTSRVYRQSSDAPDELWQMDPRNEHLARGPRFRLPVHAVRDQALLLSGRLDRTIGGPPVVLDEVRGKDGKPMNVPFKQSNRRRTLYTFWKRNSPHPMLAVFDVADRNQCEVRTMRTNTPLQALVTLNEPGYAACADALGKRARNTGETEADQLRWVWLACTGRVPEPGDLDLLQTMLRQYRDLSGDEDQAWTTLCNVLLNLDATLTLE